MSTLWKIVVVLSFSLNLVCFGAIAELGERLVEAQAENLSLFQKLSADQQSLRRELNQKELEVHTAAPVNSLSPLR